MSSDAWQEILSQSTVPGFPGVYVLGCFAKYVTLYSQQVRALNLIYALHKAGHVFENSEIMIIGAGAAGLTASASAAFCKARVQLLEELEGAMELQANNRQRWLHPHIYDWPVTRFKGDDAGLPLLNWKAGYAEKVAEQIIASWKPWCLPPRGSIDVRFNVSEVAIASNKKKTTITWNDNKGAHLKTYPVIIVAVGFGLEPRTDYQDSYWAEDDFDGGFRNPSQRPTWLVSGYGDGAFTDLMRLCIKKFRHAEIANLFATATGIDGLIKDLVEMHLDARASDPQFLSESFEKLSTTALEKLLADRIRQHGPEVFITGENPYRYGAKASILNRLIVLLLARHGAFKYVPGPTGEVVRIKNEFEVKLGSTTRKFNRVLLRHGTKPKLEESILNIWNACETLRESWKDLRIEQDITRIPQWPVGFYGSETMTSPIDTLSSGVSAIPDADRFGIRAASLSAYKELRGDGSSTITYELHSLSVLRGSISGLHFRYVSGTGQIGSPVLDTSAQRLGLTWHDDPDMIPLKNENGRTRDEWDSLLRARNKARRLSGVLRFQHPLTPHDPPVSFALTITILNGDAVSTWEFEQFYASNERVYVNNEPLKMPEEYFSWVVWLPLEMLKLRITLPDRAPGPPFPGLFAAPKGNIEVEEVVQDSILLLHPTPSSKWHPDNSQWQMEGGKPLVEAGLFTSSSPQSWELAVPRPSIGTCYSLEWPLPESSLDPQVVEFEKRARKLRNKLLMHGDRRRNRRSDAQSEAINQRLSQLYEYIHDLYGENTGKERFGVSVMTYDEQHRRLTFIDGIENGKDSEQKMWEFWLPFGLGLAGASFKDGERAYFYVRPPKALSQNQERTGPEFYLNIPEDEHKVLIAIPLDHPLFDESVSNVARFERSRQTVGVIDIGSDSPTTKLLTIPNQSEGIKLLKESCQQFCDDVYQILEQ